MGGTHSIQCFSFDKVTAAASLLIEGFFSLCCVLLRSVCMQQGHPWQVAVVDDVYICSVFK
jgi:hypothetical protein